MTSLLVIFRAFFSFFFCPPTLNLEIFPVNQLIKKFWPEAKSCDLEIEVKTLPVDADQTF